MLVIVLFCGAAFASETPSHVVKPEEGKFKSNLKDVAWEWFTGNYEDVKFAFEKLLGEGSASAIDSALQAITAKGKDGAVVHMRFLKSSGNIIYNWPDKQKFYHFIAGEFKEAPIVTSAIAEIQLYPGYYGLESGDDVHVFGLEELDRDSGGCSALQLGAIVLFLLPALALLRRGKNKK